MSRSYMIRALPPGLIARAKQRAREDKTTLDAVLTQYLATYADGRTPAQAASRGGQARAASLTADERRESARRAAQARWQRPSEPT